MKKLNDLENDIWSPTKNLGLNSHAFIMATVAEMAQSEKEMPGITGTQPEIINHHTPDGAKRLQYLLKQCEFGNGVFNPKPYQEAHEELRQLAIDMANVPNTQQEIIDQMVAKLSLTSSKISKQDIISLITANSLPADLLSFSRDARALGGSNEVIEKDSRWIWFSQTKELIPMIGPDAYYLLIAKARSLGLIPFEALDKLRNLKIRCIGASAVTHLIDLLVCLGAENMEWYDSGTTAPSNMGRLGDVGKVGLLGAGKASSLEDVMHSKNPYAHFVGTQGKVLPPLQKLDNGDVDYVKFMGNAKLVIEVIDNAAEKMGIRLYIKENHPDVKVIYIADVSNPIAGVEYTQKGNHFSQGLPEDVFIDLLDKAKEISTQEDSPEKSLAAAQLNLKSVVLMLLKDFPPEHQVQFLYIAMGLIPFWSQTAISARESAAIGSKLVLMMLMGDDVVGINYTAETIPKSLVPNYSVDQLETLREVMINSFNLDDVVSFADPIDL